MLLPDFNISNHVHSRWCRFIIQRYLGQFLERNLSLDQLSVDLTSGRVNVKDVNINVQYVNDLFAKSNVPLNLVDGFIGEISIEIPWKSLVSDSSSLLIDNLQLTFQAKDGVKLDDKDLVASMLGSVVESLVSSQELARSFCDEEEQQGESSELGQEGIQSFTKVIDAIISRFRMEMKETTVRFENPPQSHSELCTALEFRINLVEFMDEQLRNCKQDGRSAETITNQPQGIGNITNLNKFLKISGLEAFTDVFSRVDGFAMDDPNSTSLVVTSMYIRREKMKQGSQRSPTISPTSSICPGLSESTMSSVTNFQSCHSTLAGFDSVSANSTSEFKVMRIEPDLSSDPVKFAELVGESNVIIRICNSNDPTENIDNKIEFEVFFKGVHVFISPSQIEIVKRFFNSVALPQSKEFNHKNGKPMEEKDYNDIVRDIESKQTTNPRELGSGNWCQPDEFCEFDSATRKLSEEGTFKTLKCEGKRGQTKIKATLGSLLIFIPHHDPLATESNLQKGHYDAIKKSQELSIQFFSLSSKLRLTSGTALHTFRSQMDKLYPDDHIRFVASSVVCKYEMEKSPRGDRLVMKMIVNNCDFLEFLTPNFNPSEPDRCHLPIFDFSEVENVPERDPHLKLVCTINGGEKSPAESVLYIGKCKMELDFSLVDRLSELISPRPFFDNPHGGRSRLDNVNRGNLHLNEDLFAQSTAVESRVCNTWSLICNSLTVDLRVPVVDAPNATDSLLAHRKRNVHPEFIKLVMKAVAIDVPLTEECFSAVLKCSELTGDFCGDSDKLGKVADDDRRFLYGAPASLSDKVQLAFTYDPRNKSLKTSASQIQLMNDTEAMTRSFSMSVLQNQPVRDGPFSQTRRKFANCENDIIQPGSRQEMEKFASDSMQLSDVVLQVDIPVMKLFITNHSFLEVLYNRLVNDLALWKPRAPALNPSTSDVNINALETRFHEYKGSERDDDDETLDDSSSLLDMTFDRNKSHQFSILFNVEKANILLGTVLKENNLVRGPSQVSFELCGLQLFTVAGYHHDINHTFFHFTSDKVSAGHRNYEQSPSRGLIQKNVSQRDFGKWHRDEILLDTLSSKDPFHSNEAGSSVAVAMHLHARPDENVKDILLAVALRHTCARLKPFSDIGQYWVTQLIELFNLTDYDIAGYEPPIVTNDIQVHLDNVVLAYDHDLIKPDSPTRLRLVLGQTNISSSLVSGNESSKLTCIFEKSKLYMSNDKPKEVVTFKNDSPNSAKNDGYILVMNVGLFHLEVLSSLLSDRDLDRRSTPLIEVVCKNDFIKVWTCADSLVTLLNLGTEISQSDAIRPVPMEDSVSVTSAGDDADSVAGGSTWSRPGSVRRSEEVPTQHPSEERKLQERIRMAMKDGDDGDCIAVGTDAVREFSTNYSRNSKEKSPMSDILSEELADRSRPYSFSTDDSFCMIDDTIGSGITNSAGEPTIKRIGTEYPPDEPIPIDYQHFPMPDQWRADGLGALPENQSVPLVRYMISDIGVQFHIFGGSDLSERDAPSSYSVAEYNRGEGKGQKVDPDAKGGPYRDHSVSVVIEMKKVSFLYQMFNKESPVMCTTLFSIHDIVIEDRLTISSMKELMHQYSNSTQPRRTCAPMFALRIVESHKREGKIRMSMLPVKLNIDQDTMNFLEEFVGDVSSAVQLPNEVTQSVASRPLREVPAEPIVPGRKRLIMPQPEALNLVPLTPSPVHPLSPLGDLSYLEDRSNGHSSPVKRPLIDAPLTASAVSIGNIFEPRSQSANTSSPVSKTSNSPDFALKDSVLLEDDEGGDLQGDWNSAHEQVYPDLVDNGSVSVDDILSRSTMEGSIHPAHVQNDLVDTSSDDVHGDLDNERSTICDDTDTEMGLSQEREVEGEYDEMRGSTFYKEFVFSPSVSVFIDYCGKNKFADKGGPVLGIVKGLGNLNKAELVLKEINHRNGILGLGKCINFAVNEWSEDIVTNLPNVLATCGPISPLVQIGKGFLDLFWLPVTEIRKDDGHVVKGIQKGVGSFGLSSAAGVIGIAQTAVGAVQTLSETVLYEVQPQSPFLNKRNRRSLGRPVAPTDWRHGVQLAYGTFAEGVRQTRDDLELAAQEDRASGNTSVRTILRFATPAFIRPLVMLSQASYQFLGGIRNQLRPDMYQDECHKWRDEDVPGCSS